jgi:uncharacterized protein YoxC
MGEMIGLAAVVLLLGIPIVAILTHHQRKMAELIHAKHNEINPVVIDEVERLRAEVQRLRTELHETTIALDDVRRLKPSDLGRIEQRIGDGS